MQKILVMLGAAAIAIGSILPLSAFADVAALSVTVSGNDASVSVAEGVLDDTSKLYLVWDTEDRGTSLADWPRLECARRSVRGAVRQLLHEHGERRDGLSYAGGSQSNIKDSGHHVVWRKAGMGRFAPLCERRQRTAVWHSRKG